MGFRISFERVPKGFKCGIMTSMRKLVKPLSTILAPTSFTVHQMKIIGFSHKWMKMMILCLVRYQRSNSTNG